MASLRIDEKVFQTEREVVKEERRMRVENQPYGRLNEIIYDQAFTVHPYKHPTIGSMKDLEAASIEDVREFFRTYYVPEQRDAVVVGRLRHEGRRRRWCSSISAAFRSRRAVPRDIPQEPPQTKERRVTLERAGRCRRWSSRTTSPSTASRFVSAAHRVEGAVRRPELAHLPEAGLREAAGAGGVRRRQHHRGSEPVLRRGDRAAGHTPEDADEALIAELDRLKTGADHRGGAAAGQEPVRARLHPGPRVEQGQGAAARARGRHPQRHQDRGRRVRHLHEHHRRRRAARRADTTSRPRTGWC